MTRNAVGKDKCSTLLEKFVYSLKYSHELQERPDSFREDLLVLFYKAIDYANMSIRKQEQYDRIMTTQIDIIARQDYAHDMGVEEGEAKKSREIAKQMLAKSYSPKEVAEITGLSAEEVAKL